MKKLLLGTLALLFMVSLSFGQESKVIGSIKDGVISLNFNEEMVLQEINGLEGSSLVYTSIEIKEGIDQETMEKYFFLQLTDNDKKMSTAIVLENQNSSLVLRASASGGTVNCTGCSYGCDPERVGGKWYCSGGCGSSCTKSVTITFAFFQVFE